MTYNAKAILIQFILTIVSGIIMITLILFFESKELKSLSLLSSCLMPTTLGLYILFGKYIYLCGCVITKPLRIVTGLYLILLVPVVWLIRSYAG